MRRFSNNLASTSKAQYEHNNFSKSAWWSVHLAGYVTQPQKAAATLRNPKLECIVAVLGAAIAVLRHLIRPQLTPTGCLGLRFSVLSKPCVMHRELCSQAQHFLYSAWLTIDYFRQPIHVPCIPTES